MMFPQLFSIFFFFISFKQIVGQNCLATNGVLGVSSCIYSQNLAVKACIKSTGDLCIFNSAGASLWCLGKTAVGSTGLYMQGDGNLVLYQTPPTYYWYSGTNGQGTDLYLLIQNNQNLVVRNPSGRVKWSCNGLSSNKCPLTTCTGDCTNNCAYPTAMPTVVPTAKPTFKPTISPSIVPTINPTIIPTLIPTYSPTINPSQTPTFSPTLTPSQEPTFSPTCTPTYAPSLLPTLIPSSPPSYSPTVVPTPQPTLFPTYFPTLSPSQVPSFSPTFSPSFSPSQIPTFIPTVSPSLVPSLTPTWSPSLIPTFSPISESTLHPSNEPTFSPSMLPSLIPSLPPSNNPTESPSLTPTQEPSLLPSIVPTQFPTEIPSVSPSKIPSLSPSQSPSVAPSFQPSELPTHVPTFSPSLIPTFELSLAPSPSPTYSPSCDPSKAPSYKPSLLPTTQITSGLESPTSKPTEDPSYQPTLSFTFSPTIEPTYGPSIFPTVLPTQPPSFSPTESPSFKPSESPSLIPSFQPSQVPNFSPTESPQFEPTSIPTMNATLSYSQVPSLTPTIAPSYTPTLIPTLELTISPSISPSIFPTESPTLILTVSPSEIPSFEPTNSPTQGPSALPSYNPTVEPSSNPSKAPTFAPSVIPSNNPSYDPSFLPTFSPSEQPSEIPSWSATLIPTLVPTILPSHEPSEIPTLEPSQYPSNLPTFEPSTLPSEIPTQEPIIVPTLSPTTIPTMKPSVFPSFEPSEVPTETPTFSPLAPTEIPSPEPTVIPSLKPSENLSYIPTIEPSTSPSEIPTQEPTLFPTEITSPEPTVIPSLELSENPSCVPTIEPSMLPREIPTQEPTLFPTIIHTQEPSVSPSFEPSEVPTEAPSETPTYSPTLIPTVIPSFEPSYIPSLEPSEFPTLTPSTLFPTFFPSLSPSYHPTAIPSFYPTKVPSREPSISPSSTSNPSKSPSLKPSLRLSLNPSLAPSLNPTSVCSQKVYAKILGKSQRSMTVASKLSLSSQAYLIKCNGQQTSASLFYRWQVLDSANNANIYSFVSSSKDKTKFLLSPYTLTVGSSYLVRLNVTDTTTGLYEISYVAVNVVKSKLVAVISPFYDQFLNAGASLTLDGSSSYDPDVSSTSTKTSFVYSWSCSQQTPTISSVCPLGLSYVSNTNNAKIRLKSTVSSINTSSLIFLQITDANNRVNNASVLIKVVKDGVPLVSITSALSSLTNVNTDRRLTLSGIISSNSSCESTWSVDDFSLSLPSSTLASYSQYITAGSTSVLTYLYLTTNALKSQSSYVFSLSCGASLTSVLVTTNGPPLGGTFAVNPSEGIELTTFFSFVASSWSDSDLPLTYHFSFLSPSTSSELTIQSKNELSYASSTLPSGSASLNYVVTSLLYVYDGLDSASKVSFAVKVSQLPQQAASVLLLSQLNQSTSSGSVDALKQVVSIASAVLSKANCSLAPDCSSLNRNNCSTVANTCGACLSGFVGQSGSSNSLCISTSSYLSNTQGVCASDNDCEDWQQCDSQQRRCVDRQKACVNDCSGHGVCSYEDSNTAVTVTSCSWFASTCTAVCSCEEGFAGEACSWTSDDLIDFQNVKYSVLSSLNDVMNAEDVSKESLSNAVSTMSTLISSTSDLSSASIDLLFSLANATITNAFSLEDLTYDDISSVLTSLNILFSSQSLNTSSSLSSTFFELLTSVSQFNVLISQDQVPGGAAVDFIHSNYRLSNKEFSPNNPNISVTIPRSWLEELNKQPFSSLSINLQNQSFVSETILLQLIETKSKLLAVNESALVNIHSNVLSVNVSGVTSVHMTLAHVSEVNVSSTLIEPSSSSIASDVFVTNCSDSSDYHSENFTCSNSGLLLIHRCEGRVGNLTTICPAKRVICALLDPSNHTLLHDNHTCQAIGVSDSYTQCTCAWNQETSANRRYLTTVLQTTGILSVVSISTYLAEDIRTTFDASSAFLSPGQAEKAMIVIMIFATLWSSGFLLIGICFTRAQAKKKDHQTIKDKFQQEIQKKNDEIPTSEMVFQQLSDYIQSLFPTVFTSKSFVHRVQEEIFKNHRYLLLITSPIGEKGDQKRILIAIQLMTTLSMMLFLLALFFDLQSPSDDGSCASYTTQTTCLQRKSMFDTTQTYCQWDVNNNNLDNMYGCSYQSPNVGTKAVIYIAIIVSLITSLIMHPLTYIFDLLSAPDADELRAMLADTMVKRVGRRLSNVGQQMTQTARRISQVAIDTGSNILSQANQLKQRRLAITAGSQTRDIPEDIQKAHRLARSSMIHLVDQVQNNIQQTALRRQITRHSLIQTQPLPVIKPFPPKITVIHEEDEDDEDEEDDEEEKEEEGDEEVDNEDNISEESEDSSSSDEENQIMTYDTKKSTVLSDEECPKSTSLHDHIRSPEPLTTPSVTTSSTTQTTSSSTSTTKTLDTLFQEFQQDLLNQRNNLSSFQEQQTYDQIWGLNSSGTFPQESTLVQYIPSILTSTSNPLVSIKQEIKRVQQESKQKITKLQIATDVHQGLELLHLFILDLLGHNTPAALIFKQKTEEDFHHTHVVTRQTKFLALCLILCANIFFAYYAILKGYVKQIAWQRVYLITSIVQVLLEICLFESLECLWINVIVPTLVTEDVQRVFDVLSQAISNLCRQQHIASIDSSKYFFNVPDYLFVSTNIAKAFPSLIESMIILSYHTHLPGELAKKWSTNQRNTLHSWYYLRHISLLSIGITCMLFLATIPFTFQRMIIRFTQPFLLSALIVIWNYIQQNCIYLIIFLVFITLILCYWIYLNIIDRKKHQIKIGMIQPMNMWNSLSNSQNNSHHHSSNHNSKNNSNPAAIHPLTPSFKEKNCHNYQENPHNDEILPPTAPVSPIPIISKKEIILESIQPLDPSNKHLLTKPSVVSSSASFSLSYYSSLNEIEPEEEKSETIYNTIDTMYANRRRTSSDHSQLHELPTEIRQFTSLNQLVEPSILGDPYENENESSRTSLSSASNDEDDDDSFNSFDTLSSSSSLRI